MQANKAIRARPGRADLNHRLTNETFGMLAPPVTAQGEGVGKSTKPAAKHAHALRQGFCLYIQPERASTCPDPWASLLFLVSVSLHTSSGASLKH